MPRASVTATRWTTPFHGSATRDANTTSATALPRARTRTGRLMAAQSGSPRKRRASTSGAADPNRYKGYSPGTVIGRTFLGEKVEYQVRVGDETLQVTRPSGASDARFAPGAAVTVRLPAAGVGLLREGV